MGAPAGKPTRPLSMRARPLDAQVTSSCCPPTRPQEVVLDSRAEPPASALPLIFLDICSGTHAPLSGALQSLGCFTLAVDPLHSEPLDLLHDHLFSCLERLAYSGIVGAGHGACACAEAPELLAGQPGAAPEQLAKAQCSSELRCRTVALLRGIRAAGGHATFEQSPEAESWNDLSVAAFVDQCCAVGVNVAACHMGLDLPKNWLLTSSWEALGRLACICEHPPGTHPNRINISASPWHGILLLWPRCMQMRFARC